MSSLALKEIFQVKMCCRPQIQSNIYVDRSTYDYDDTLSPVSHM